MSTYKERVEKTLEDEMSHYDLATGIFSRTLPALRKIHGDDCVFDSYMSFLRTHHDYPEKEGYDLFEVGVRFDPDPSLPDYAKLYEWIPFLPVYVEHGSTEVEIRKAFQASVESHKSFDLKVGSEVIVDEGGEGIFRVDVVTPLAVCGDFDGIPEEWVSWASITGVLS